MIEETFLDWIHSKKRGMITFFSDKDERNVIRECAPLDIWPRRKN